MDVAFGAIGVAGVAAQLFDSVVSMYQLLYIANGLSRDAPIALWKLKIQETRFIVWGRYWGVEAGKLDTFLQENGIHEVVVGILRQTEILLGDVDTLKSKYKMFPSQVKNMGQITAAPDSKETASIAATTPLKGKWGTKFRWAVADKSKFEDLIKDLKDFNDGLYSILRLNESISLERIIQSNLLREAPNVSETRYVKDACSEARDISEESSTRSAILYKDIYTSAQAKLARLYSTDDEAVTPSQRRPRASVEIPVVRSRSEIRCLASYRYPTELPPPVATHVMVEWKDFDPHSPVKNLIERRLNGLAFLFSPETQKPADFRILQCLGYFEDIEFPRYGMIFCAPEAAKGPVESLYNILGNTDESSLPNLGDKFELAKSLAISTLRLHDCGWIHGAFRSSNIIFFRSSSEETRDCCLQDPYIVGFKYSRPSDPAESTLEYSMTHFEHDMYRHPQVAQFASRKVLRSVDDRQRFEIAHDLYSLGIVLLEIGLWKRVFTLWKDKYDHERFLEKLICAYVPRLGPKMGVMYRDVVKDLLSLKVDQVEEARDDRMSQWSRVAVKKEGKETDSMETSTEELEATSLEDKGDRLKALGTGLSSEVYWNVVQKLGKCIA